jgi:uncharacterized protein (TIGR02147 family)
VSIFNFEQSNEYLRFYIDQLPKKGWGEIRKISQHLGISTTLVSHVLSGKKQFTSEQSQALVDYLGLIDLEAEYFMYLVQHERSGSEKLRKFWRAKLVEIKEKSLNLSQRIPRQRQLTENEKAIYYSSSMYVLLRLYTSLDGPGKTLSEISQRFDLSSKKCSEILRFLIDCGLCIEKNGYYKMGEQNTHLERSSPHLIRFQTDWRMRAIQKGEKLSEQEMMFTGPVSLSKKDFKILREKIVLFIKDYLEIVRDSPAEEVACLNIDFFWA